MKRALILFVALVCLKNAHAQVDFDIFGGPHASTAHYVVDGAKQSTDYKTGFHLGAGFRIPFDNQLYFAPDLTYKLMGYKVVFNQPSFPPDLLAKNNNTSFHEMDIDVLLHLDLGKKPNHLFIKGGPSFSFILSGKEKFDLATGEKVNRSMKFSVLDSYGRYDAAALVEFGFESAKGFLIYADFSDHLVSMNNEDQGPSIVNHSFGLTIGKYLHHTRK